MTGVWATIAIGCVLGGIIGYLLGSRARLNRILWKAHTGQTLTQKEQLVLQRRMGVHG